MPLYEYRCTQCGNAFEKIQNFSSQLETVCPKCGGKLERPLTAPAFNFKGAGWYVNDYAPKSSSAKTDQKADGGGDSKPAESKPASTESSTSSGSSGSSTASSSPSTSGGSSSSGSSSTT